MKYLAVPFFVLSLIASSTLFANSRQPCPSSQKPANTTSNTRGSQQNGQSNYNADADRGYYEPLVCPGCNDCCGFNVPLPKPPCSCAYNAPEAINTCAAFDVYITASYLLWKAEEENLALGHSSVINTPSDSTTSELVGNSDTIQGIDFHYSSGFKVGAGKLLQKDSWELYAEYTWFHQTATASSSTEDDSNGSIFVPYWQFLPKDLGSLFLERNLFFQQGSSNWNLKVDLGALQFARRYYVGQYLTFRTFYGLQGSWIRQTYTANYKGGDEESPIIPITLQASSTSRAYSWGVGPQIGINTNWKSYSGFRLFGDAAASILYTSYYKNNIQANLSDFFLDNSSPIINNDLTVQTTPTPNYLRANLDFGLGIGWGAYFCSSRYYLDLKAGYSFHIFFNQNIFPSAVSTGVEPIARQYITTYGNLYLHGLDITAGFQF